MNFSEREILSSSHPLKITKILVLVMTCLIAIGLAFLGYGLSINGQNFGESPALVRAVRKAEGIVCADLRVPFGSVTLHQAPGTRITSMVADNQYLILRLDSGEQGERVIVIDLVAGRVLGTVTVESASAPAQ